MEASNRFLMPDLKKICIAKLIEFIDFDNVYDLLDISGILLNINKKSNIVRNV